MPEPWEQKTGESSKAYQAFCLYRDMGPTRTLLDAYKQAIEHQRGRGQVDPNRRFQTSGQWAGYARRYDWEHRALAYDHRLSLAKLKGAEIAATEQGHLWQGRRDEHAERLWKVYLVLMAKAETVAAFPVTRTTVARPPSAENPAGSPMTVEAVNIEDLLKASRLALNADQLAWNAISEGMPNPDDEIEPKSATDKNLERVLRQAGRL